MDYTCRAQKLSGAGTIQNTKDPRRNVQEEGSVQIAVSLPVRSLDCGKRAMNRDMYDALRAESHPAIRYRLLEARLSGAAADEPEEWMRIRTRGIMEIAGVSDTTVIRVQGRVLDENRFRVRGSMEIYMDTYNIKPPTALLGLIRADKHLLVHFDVTVQLQE